MKKNREVFYAVYRKALRLGLIIKRPCEKCGTSKKIHGHHADYRRPLKVMWLCQKHHNKIHGHYVKGNKTRLCTECKKRKVIKEFTTRDTGWHNAFCKSCMVKRMVAWRLKNLKKYRTYQNKYHKTYKRK